MRKSIVSIFVFLCYAIFLSYGQGEVALKAKDFLKFLEQKDFEKATSMFNQTLLEQMPAARLMQVWAAMEMQAGKFIGSTEIFAEKQRDFEIVIQTCEFEKTSLDLRLVFDDELKIGGIFFTPPRPKDQYILPPYNRPDKYRQRSAEIVTGDFRLPALLTIPEGEGPFPLVILVHGSGAHDKDETIGPNKPFADLAAGLSSNGIAVLRYDKRNSVYGEKAFEGLEVNLYYETIEDVLSAVEFVKADDLLDNSRIYILGHSLGAMAAPRIAASVPGLKGIILMAGNARPLEDLILEQVNYLSKEQNSPELQEYIGKLRQQVANARQIEKNPYLPPENLPLNIPASYWLDLKKNNHVEIARGLGCKILILQGERDYQVSMTDFKTWQRQLRRNKNVDFKSYPKLNHLFLEGDGKSLPKEYEVRGNIPLYVIQDILNWMNRP